MAVDIPTVEPSEVRAGDTWTWERSLSDYPAPTWTLAYALLNAAGKISITAAASGTDHLVSVAAATTANYTPGTYSAVGRVTSGTEAVTVWTGSIQVLPNLAAATSYDDRSHARRVLQAIEAVIEGRASSDQQEIQIGDRMLKKIPIGDLLKLRDSYTLEVASEESASRLAQGIGGRGRVMVRL
jgi:hypothetical protein